MMHQTQTTEQNFEFSAETKQTYPEILTDKAIDFLTELHQKFNNQRLLVLDERKKQQLLFDDGALPCFPIETKNIRESNWRAAAIPKDLLDRRVEITGPVDRKMVINALNSGAKTFMADFEDSTSPTWSNLMSGQQNLKDAVNKTSFNCSTKRTAFAREKYFDRRRANFRLTCRFWIICFSQSR
jgi:malate synthase